MDISDVERTLAFITNDGVDFADIEVTLTKRLSMLLQQHITLWFNCPIISASDGPPPTSDEQFYLAFESETLKASIRSISTNAIQPREPYRTIFFESFDEEGLIKPKIIVEFSHTVESDSIPTIEKLIHTYISSMLRRQYSTMRRAIINAKIDSDDLGSFLFRLFNRHNFHKLMSAEAAGIFAIEHSNMLRLRGTTGLASGVHMAEISFHLDDEVNVARVFRDKSPKIEFGRGQPLTLGRSAEVTTSGQFAKAYWPLRVRSTSSPAAQIHAARPCIGVIRIVNYATPHTHKAPFTWIPICCLIYAAESLYNVLDSFIATDEASFNKDAAFHAAQSVTDTIAKNIDVVRRAIFDDIYPELQNTKPLFFLSRRNDQSNIDPNRLKTILNTAHASAKALGFQIDRANLGLPKSKNEWTPKIITDVLIRALETVEDMRISHSALEPIERPYPGELFKQFEKQPMPPPVRGSPEALISVFANLCENSVKYRKVGKKIRIRLSLELQPTHLEIRFRDYGIGVLAGEEERIFTRGYRTPRARDHAVRGGGLGLAWCREVLEFYSGSISARRHDDGLEMIVRLSTT